MVPEIRIQSCNDASVNSDGDYVLYWMIANRRVRWNFSLDRTIEWAEKLNKPLLLLEALRCDYAWASDRLHRFILEGMADNARRLQDTNVTYYPYVERKTGAGKGLLSELAKQACVIITDDFPAFFLPRMIEAAAQQVSVHMEKVDSNGLLPMRAAEKEYARAYDFRRFLQKVLPNHLTEFPTPEPIAESHLPKLSGLPKSIEKRWPRASLTWLDDPDLGALPIDHSVAPAQSQGGSKEAEDILHNFLNNKLSDYSEQRNEPEKAATSGMSAYLHFGHISVHQIFYEIMQKEDWSLNRLSPKTTGSRSGWWGVSDTTEAFLDELITWRELGYNMCYRRADYEQYQSLPDWAKQTLAEHDSDPREYIYTEDEFERGRTHDPLWNAAQMQLVREGRIHNYLRMLWGKKILEWTKSPQEALHVMIELNNKYALDGRNPNSYSGIFWVLGRYDRAWGPERPIFGKVRYMSSENTARKFQVKNYIETYQP
ncbi:deoxyribodipyrimidine photolyase [candidate division KSB1 bacterium]|nr:deoxyribodipyrimidine photolyase [candidate division KSB1 bacterium]NIR70655.1 deoxyribodipyrimidine photolyase [candidate division KSB1 bacterium]NIS23143.1 deoxyribodipyrimidine photolyase [candidate division KSB1 bacterium]NIT70004.1 deoxyribodipyrimidine photolyase [candidate division KSB1 bacterium]NIU23641.1 deoxyribodipyrimidine photolyase [candidate division KSB1 bacterium]